MSPTTPQDELTATDGGVDFPPADGRRPTSPTGRAVIADALRRLDLALAVDVEAEADWRHAYLEAYRRMTELAVATREATATISAEGLSSVHRRFVFTTPDGDTSISGALAEGLAQARRGMPGLFTVTVDGGRPPEPHVLSVPYAGARLVADDLNRRLEAWTTGGVVEPSFAEAIRAVIANPDWLDLRDVTVVLLGAGAEMGPFVSLVRWGAHVVAVDLPGYATWSRLLGVVRDSCGRMSVPVSRWLPEHADDDEIAASAGADLRTRTPDVLGWLADLEGPFLLGDYVYADGAQHVRASVAIDALVRALLAERDDVSLAYLATPTDVFGVPEEVVADSRRRYEQRTVMRRLSRLGSAGRLFEPNYPVTLTTKEGRLVGLADSLVPQQGPNYALAKRIQRWRALHERSNGRFVSINVAPATRTRSVVRNRALAAAFAGASRFGVEVFEPSTSNTLMAAMLVHDLRNPASVANPATPLVHPLELLWSGAAHGGLWRNAFAPRSVLGLAVVLGMVQHGA